MEPEGPRPPGIRDEPLIAIGIAGFFFGGVFFELLRETVPRGFDSISDLPVVRLELAAMTTRVAALVVALLGVWSLWLRLPRSRVGLVAIAVGMTATLVVELARIRYADWRCPAEDAYCGTADRISLLMIDVQRAGVPLVLLGLALLARSWMVILALPLILLAAVAGPDPSPFVWWPDTWWRDWPHQVFRDMGWLRLLYGLACGVGALVLLNVALGRVVPRAPSAITTAVALRRLGVALLVLGGFALVVAFGTQATDSADVAVIACGIGCLIAVAILASSAALASHAAAPALRGWASIATALLTWAFVLHAIHGFLMYGEWLELERWRAGDPELRYVFSWESSLYGDWLIGMVTFAPLVSLGGWLALVVGLSRARGPSATGDLEANLYGIGIAFLGLLTVYGYHLEIPRLDDKAEALPGLLVVYLAPPMLLVPLLRRGARQLERASELAAARLSTP